MDLTPEQLARLTPAERLELATLRSRKAQEKDLEQGKAEAAAVHSRTREETEGFSLSRVVIGAGKDVIENTAEFARDVIKTGQTIGRKLGGTADTFDLPEGEISLGKLEGEDNAGVAENLARGILGFIVPYTGWAKAYKVGKAATWLGAAGRAALAGSTTVALHQDPQEANLANVLRDTFKLDSDALDYIASTDDENQIVSRLKAAAVDIPVSLATDGLFRLGGMGIQAYKRWRGEAAEAKGIIEAMNGTQAIKRPAAKPDDAVEVKAPDVIDEEFDASKHLRIKTNDDGTPAESLDGFLKRMSGVEELDEMALRELGAIVHDDPENALLRLGLDPAKVDWAEYANPEGMKNLADSMRRLYERVGRGLGRTGQVVDEASLHSAARALATDAEVMRDLFGRTSGLAEVFMGARMFVGGHGHKLLDAATRTLDALKAGGADKEALWGEFLQDFYRHAYFLGALRGAGTEVGRALRALRFVARKNPKQAEKMADEMVKDAAGPASKDPQLDASDTYHAVLDMEDDAERMMLLSKLIDKGADIGALSQYVRAKNGSALRRLGLASKETIGNLFSIATAGLNVASGVSILSMRAMGRFMAAGTRGALGIVSEAQAREARIALADAWAYTDGVLSAWRPAVRGVVNVMTKELSNELFMSLDNLGMKTLAKRAAAWHDKARKELGVQNFERIDMETSSRDLAYNTADRRKFEQMVESHDLGTLTEHSLKWLARAGGQVVNIGGSLSRAGTILFINAPDQFVGQMAAKAGAQSFAIRHAARRAAELGLEGKDLTKFLKAHVATLADDVNGWSPNSSYVEGMREAAAGAGEHEAREILFQDPMDFAANRTLSKLHHQSAYAHILIPFFHTPMRIMERTAIDYTPLGIFKDRIWEAIMRGTPAERDQAITQITLGTLLMGYAVQAAMADKAVGTDGGWQGIGRLARDQFTIQIGGDSWEYLRFDPAGTLLGLGATVVDFMEVLDQADPEQIEKGKQLMAAGIFAVAANVLSKTYLESVDKFMSLAETDGRSPESYSKAVRAYAQSVFARRAVPAAGIQKGLQQTIDPWTRSALTFQEKMVSNSLLAGDLPQKHDWLGEPVKLNVGERFLGLAVEPAETDPLRKELASIPMSAKLPQRNLKGVQLDARQYERLLALRGQVKDPKNGNLTLRETLERLISDPRWESATKWQKEAVVQLHTKDYSKLAREQLLSEDENLAKRVLRKEIDTDNKKNGLSDEERRAANEQLGRELGLTE